MALVHALRGRRSNRKLDEKVQQKALEILKPGGLSRLRSDAGGGISGRETRHSCGARDRAEVDDRRQTVARPAASVVEKIHQWRPRRSRVGELVQWDTSEHAWLEERGPKLYLISMIDDASSRVHARFVLHDSKRREHAFAVELRGAVRPAGQLLHRQGEPVSNCAEDARDSKELPRDERDPLPPTQIGRALGNWTSSGSRRTRRRPKAAWSAVFRRRRTVW
jgi:hypothetical protein